MCTEDCFGSALYREDWLPFGVWPSSHTPTTPVGTQEWNPQIWVIRLWCQGLCMLDTGFHCHHSGSAITNYITSQLIYFSKSYWVNPTEYISAVTIFGSHDFLPFLLCYCVCSSNRNECIHNWQRLTGAQHGSDVDSYTTFSGALMFPTTQGGQQLDTEHPSTGRSRKQHCTHVQIP